MSAKFITTSVVGQTNVGKSTLVNALVGRKVSIVTPRAQTTRSTVLGMSVVNDVQILFTDNPGVSIPKSELDKSIIKCAWHGIDQGSLILLVVDSSSGHIGQLTASIIARLTELPPERVLVALNKVDQSSIEKMSSLKASVSEMLPGVTQFMVSAIAKVGTGALLSHIASIAPEAPWQEGAFMPLQFMTAEITREQILLQVRGELPYSLTVETEQVEELGGSAYVIKQVVTVPKDSHKVILIGKRGARIKSIGEQARREMYKALGLKVQLRIFVRVKAVSP